MKSKLVVIDPKAEAEKLLATLVKLIKSKHGHVAFTYTEVSKKEYKGQQVACAQIGIETNIGEWVCDEASGLISKIEYAKLASASVAKGFFDWSSDTYIKDSAIISFMFHPTF
jgi:hypothetical protein